MGNVLQEVVHGALKNGWAGRDAENQTVVLEQPLVGVDGHILFRVLIQQQLLVRVTHVQFCKCLSSCQCGEQILNSWQGISVKL